jgi:hypothetical protein
MSADGTYSFLYAGLTGPGFGILSVENGDLIGSDFMNGKYVGTAKQLPNGGVSVSIRMDIPVGVSLVDGTGAEPMPYSRHLWHEFPPGAFGDGSPQLLRMENNTTIQASVYRIHDRFRPSARGFTVELPTE